MEEREREREREEERDRWDERERQGRLNIGFQGLIIRLSR
jgi:hypothetical protein